MSMNELNTQLDYLAETKNLLKTAITDKGQNIEDNTPFRNYVEKVNDISTLSSETADATATAYELLNGRTAYVKGQKITGTITTGDMTINGTTKFVQDDTVLPLIKHYPTGTLKGEVVNLKKSQIDMSVLEGKQYTIVYYERKSTSNQPSDIGLIIIVFGDDTTKYARNNTGLTIFSYKGENQTNMTIYSATYNMEGHSINDFKWSDFTTETKSSITISTSNASVTFYIYNTADYTQTTGLTQSKGFINMNDKYLLQKTTLAANLSQFYAKPETTNIYTPIEKDILATSIGLTSDKLIKGSKVLNVTGTAETGIDTSDATATSDDIVESKTAYVNGEKITGNLKNYITSGEEAVVNYQISVEKNEPAAGHGNPTLDIVGQSMTKSVIGLGAQVRAKANYNTVATAIGLTTDKIVKGNTILGIEGSAESGVDTSDATATENDITQNKTAYVNGTKITGAIDTYSGSSMRTMPGSEVSDNWSNPQGDPQQKYVCFKVKPAYINGSFSMPAVDSKPICFKENSELGVLMSQSSVAEAIGLTADKIVSGNTILSIAGTAESGIDTSDGTATAGDLSKDKTAYVNGQKITGTLTTFTTPLTYTFYIGQCTGIDTADDLQQLKAYSKYDSDILIRSGVKSCMQLTYAEIANAIGLTADKIKSGETVLGVTGTYTGE